MEKELIDIVNALHLSSGILKGNKHAKVKNIQFNSKLVTKNSLFCALKGVHTDGHLYINHAIEKGASAILCSSEEHINKILTNDIGIYIVPDHALKRFLAEISAIFYDYPSEHLKLIGVTGTDGKSTTVSFIHQLLTLHQIKGGFLSTINFFDGYKITPNKFRQSTPEAPQIHHALSRILNNNCSVAIIETTSHGLSQETARTHGLRFDIGILTNIYREHLEFHKSTKNYAHAKSNLFKKIKSNGIGIIHKEQKYKNIFVQSAKEHGAQIYTFAIDEEADFYITNITHHLHSIQGTIVRNTNRFKTEKKIDFELNCIGDYNLKNLLVSVMAANIIGIPLQNIQKYIPKITTPRGRMEIVTKDLSILPIVDYAHTPSSFLALFSMIKKIGKGKIIAVFGSAGERDISKREEQGNIADSYADIIILTNEDPRKDDPMKILEDIALGCASHKKDKNLFLIPDRQEAIMLALSLTEKNDTVLFLGKGHEKTIEHADHIQEWNEVKEVKKAIKKLLPQKNW